MIDLFDFSSHIFQTSNRFHCYHLFLNCRFLNYRNSYYRLILFVIITFDMKKFGAKNTTIVLFILQYRRFCFHNIVKKFVQNCNYKIFVIMTFQIKKLIKLVIFDVKIRFDHANWNVNVHKKISTLSNNEIFDQ